MKICLVSLKGLNAHLADPPGPRGGSETQIALLAQALHAHGHEVSVVVTDYSGDVCRHPRATDVRLLQAFDSRAGIFGIRFVSPRWTGLHAALKRADADVYFQRGADAATGQVAFFCRRAGRGFVFGTASDSDVHPRLYRLGARRAWLYRRGLARADRIITQHEEQRERSREHFATESTVIGSICPHPPRAGTPAQPPVVLWLGNFREVKRPEVYLAIARRFPAVRFVMVGGPVPGHEDCFARAQRLAEEVPNVELRGQVADPGPELDRAWVLLNTSQVEGFPSSFLEAWAHGVPTASFFDPGGIVAGHDLGVLGADEDGLAAGLGEILASRARRDALGARGLEYVAREHRPDAISARYEEVFREVAGRVRTG